MKVTCQSCQAKYTIADEKVRGKVAKIRCKKCGTTIIVNGTDGTGTAAAEHAHPGASDEQWSVLVADGDQRTATAAQVADMFASGSISLETPVWKDGMADWLPISQVDALRGAIEGSARVEPGLPLASLLPDVLPAAASPPPLPGGADLFAPKTPAAAAARIHAPDPAARRRPRGGSTDLFGGGGLDDVMTSASTDPVPHAGNDKPTGARNENSVLFSLASLTGGGGSAPAATKPAINEKDPASGRADLRSLMAGTDIKSAPAKSKIDDIINLSSGGVYSPGMLAAPVLAPAPPDLSSFAEASTAGSGKSKGKGLLLAIVGAVLLIGVGAFAFTAMSGKGESDRALAAASASAKAAAEALAVALAAAESNKQQAAETPPAATADQPAQAPTVLSPGQNAAKPEPEKRAPANPKPDKPEKPAAAPNAAALGVPAPAQAPAPAAPAAGGSGEFDRAAALSALSAAATAAQSCRKADGPTGSGRIAVTFANSGQATTANVDGPPFAGTAVGGCVAARFRGTRVPPYGGAPVTVHKTFNIN